MEPAHVLAFAAATAREAGALLLDYFGRELEITTKSSAIDLVTSADRAAEALIIERVRARFPDHGVLAEESGQAVTGADQRAPQWIIDPLDGTTNFAHKLPHFCVSIALEDQDGALVGVVHDPARGETFTATRGGGAWLESAITGARQRLRVSDCASLGAAVLATGFSYARARPPSDPAWVDNLAEFVAVTPRLRGVRRAGSAALDLAYVAAGRLDG
ncbi:MAG: inositol monophosphatase, partial [Myxococcales bacterium]|nr:inositol monophosphatase [Myxococcales bacterium]